MGFTRHRPDLCSPEKPRVAATFIPLINRLIYGLWGAREPRSLLPPGGRRSQAAPRLREDAGGSPNHQGPLRSHQSQGHSNARQEDLEGGSAGDAGSAWELCCVSITVHEDQLLTGFPPPPSCKPAGPRRRRVSRQVWQTLSAPSPGESNEARAKVLSGERERPTEPLPSESGQARGTGKSH